MQENENENEVNNDSIAGEPEAYRQEDTVVEEPETLQADEMQQETAASDEPEPYVAPVSPETEPDTVVTTVETNPVANPNIAAEQPILLSEHVQSGKTKKRLIVGIIIAVVLVLLAGAAWWILRIYQDSDSSMSVNQSATVYPQGAVLTSIEGTVEVNTGDGWTVATSGTNLGQGDEIRTAKDSRAILTLDEGSAIRLDASSTVAFTTLHVGDVTIDNQSGSVYTRVVPSETRTFVVTVDNAPYRAMGTAYMTLNKPDQKGVEVYESTVTTKNSQGLDEDVSQGEAFYTKDKDDSDVDKVTKLDIKKLKENSFLKWNKQQDEKDDKFANKLGVLEKIDETESDTEKEDSEAEDENSGTTEPAATAGISAWGAKVEDGIKVSWSVNGVNAADGFKVTYSNTDTTPSYGENSAKYVSAGSSSAVLEIEDGKTWHIRVCAYRGDGKCDSYSNTVSVTAPYEEKAKVTRGTMTVSRSGNTLSWSYSGKALYGYKIVWNTSGEPTYPVSGEKSGYEYISSQSTSSLNLEEAITKTGDYYIRVCAYTNGTQSDACVDYGSAPGKYSVS